MIITLTGPEMFCAGITGLGRLIDAVVNNRRPVNGQDPYRSIGDHIAGAMAEAAVAKATDHYWLGEWLNHKAIDVGPYDVRYTHYDPPWLKLQENDDPTRVYILVSGLPPRFKLCGWILGEEGQRSEYMNENLPRPCYAVPAENLEAMGKLLK